jgi:uncharacterized protein (DUF2141 family)
MIDLKKIICAFGIFTATALALKVAPVSAAYSGSLEVKFNGINSSKGQICLNLFNGQTGFPDGGKGSALIAAKCTPIIKGVAKLTFTNLPYGNYAISAIHDTNGDTRLNSNFLGMPTEGVGFSNNVVVKTAAPSFNDAQFFLSAPKTDLSIKMQYF